MEERVAIEKKILLTVTEAAAYSGLGINKVHELARQPNCPFVLWNGSKKMIKREAFDAFLKKSLCI